MRELGNCSRSFMSSMDEGLKELLVLIMHKGQTAALFEDSSVVYRDPCVARVVSIQMNACRKTTDSES